jgi:hypothetical protein
MERRRPLSNTSRMKSLAGSGPKFPGTSTPQVANASALGPSDNPSVEALDYRPT